MCKCHEVSPVLVRLWAVMGAYTGATCMHLHTTCGGEGGRFPETCHRACVDTHSNQGTRLNLLIRERITEKMKPSWL